MEGKQPRLESAHAKACDLTCIACLKKVKLIDYSRFGLSGFGCPDVKQSSLVTNYQCQLAMQRWTQIWTTNINSDYPKRICNICRNRLKNDMPYMGPKYKLPRRGHTQLLEYDNNNSCTICTNFFEKKKAGRKPKNLPVPVAQKQFIVICTWCNGEKARGKDHRCGKLAARNNIKKRIEESLIEPLALASDVVRSAAHNGTLTLPTRGRPVKVYIGTKGKKAAQNKFSWEAEDVYQHQSVMCMSGRKIDKINQFYKKALTAQGIPCKIATYPLLRNVVKSERVGDLFETSKTMLNDGTEKNPDVKNGEVVHCTNIVELARRLSHYRQKPIDIVKVEGDHGQGILKITGQFTFSNSVSTMIVLGATQESNESILTIKTMMELIKIKDLIDQLGVLVVYSGDCKFLQLLICILTGNSMK